MIAPTPFSPPTGWTRVATALLLAAMIVPVAQTVQLLANLKNCDGASVPRWDEAMLMMTASLACAIFAGGGHQFVRRRLARIRTRRAMTSGAWSIVGIVPALFALGITMLLAIHFSFEHMFDTLCIDLSGLFWHGC